MTLASKLGIKPGSSLVLDEAPDGWAVPELPDGVLIDGASRADVVVAFFRSVLELEHRISSLGQRIFPSGALWVAWPRRAGGHRSDITDNEIRRVVLPLGLVDVKVAALDEDWSGLKIVWRVENRG